ncbi:MarR family winged helix-turn-helix transcriptional regulator [Amycolatopsis magusensis]|uniref:MarR family winged helix-turn-helix transcriptional regulator n=1 Tax=Amycolatopsis magusensis TaxID=882444 RepID=UPI0024A981DC|nr:MarR family winged helix-turn-helix transcriptional regulator [Amycolatopsis magusensis]MDI5982517.1 MarR family winged helix-turn-helix transcriptional regulator [Amycolatopsis magusensis]
MSRTTRPQVPDGHESDPDVDSWPTGRLLSVAARMVESRFDDVLAAHQLTHAGLIVLHHLDTGTHTQRQLATLCKVTDQTMSRTIERLRRTDFVTTEADPADRRRTIVRLTAAGRRVLTKARREERESELLLGAVDDYEHFRSQLLKLIRHAARGAGPVE